MTDAALNKCDDTELVLVAAGTPESSVEVKDAAGAGTVSTDTGAAVMVSDVQVIVASDTALRVTWSPPAVSGNATVLKYRVEWFDAAATREVQLVTVTGAAGGSFALRLGNTTTAALPWNADAARYDTTLLPLPLLLMLSLMIQL
jgi:Fibronectin type III domain